MGKVIDIASKRKRNQIHILLCLWEDNLTKILTKFIKDKNDHEVRSLSSPHEKDLLKAAEDGSFDMFILLLNNIIYNSHRSREEDLREGAFDLVSYMKTRYKKPVIALYGYPDDPDYADKVRSAGADFVFRMPFKAENFLDAIEKCLE